LTEENPASRSIPSDWYDAKSSAAPMNERKARNATAIDARGQTPRTSNADATVPTTTRGEGKFASEGEAAQSCGAANVVWANTSTKAFHLAGDQYFGHTKHGAFMCKTTATAGGFHLAGHKS